MTLLQSRVTLFILLALGFLAACTAPRRAPARRFGKPTTERPGKNEPMDTVRWTQPNNPRPPIGSPTNPARPGGDYSGQTFRLAVLLPFLTEQFSDGEVPEKSTLALQFYSGAKLALEQISKEEGLNLVVDVFDTHASDADFQALLGNPRLDRADVYLGPIRPSHVTMLAGRTKISRKPLLSPESPSMDLTNANPNFVQFNPSLRAHCVAITQQVRRTHRPDEVVLVCKEKERDRLPYFQTANSSLGGGQFQELVVPDATVSFDKVDLRKYLRAGRTTVFIVPSWASQDFVMGFLSALTAARGSSAVEVYGMPQWMNFENIEPDYWRNLDVHVSSAGFVDHKAPAVQAFEQKFYEAYGALPDDDAFNGYDVTLFMGKMLRRYGPYFPENLTREQFKGLRTRFQFSRIYGSGWVDTGSANQYDYLENTFVHILKFDKYGFVPVDNN